MTKELREKLVALRALAPILNETTQRAGAIVEAVERLLGVELSLDISAETGPFEEEDLGTEDNDHALVLSRSLCYGRVGGRLCLHVLEATLVGKSGSTFVSDVDWERISVEEIPWSSCPRDVKLKAFTRLPELLEAIADRANELGVAAARTADTVERLLIAMRPESSA